MSAAPIRFCTFNVKNFPPMRPLAVWRDFKLAGDQAAAVYGFQELWSPNYRLALARRFPRPRWDRKVTLGPAGTAVTWDTTRFAVRWTFNHQLHGPVKGVCRQRKITGAVLRDRGTGSDLVVISVHPTPSAFSNRFREAKRRQVERVWRAGMVELRDFIAHHVRMGRHVVVLGDFNANRDKVRGALGWKIAGQPARIKTTGHGWKIDHIVLVGRWEIARGRTVGGHRSDHAPYVVEATPR